MPALTKMKLSPLRQRFVELMSDLKFGRIEHLRVVAGEPVIDSGTRMVREVSLGKGAAARERPSDDFYLKREIVDLFECLDRLGNGTILRLDLRFGIPFKMSVEEGEHTGAAHGA